MLSSGFFVTKLIIDFAFTNCDAIRSSADPAETT